MPGMYNAYFDLISEFFTLEKYMVTILVDIDILMICWIVGNILGLNSLKAIWEGYECVFVTFVLFHEEIDTTVSICLILMSLFLDENLHENIFY